MANLLGRIRACFARYDSGEYFLSRDIFLRLLGALYFVAFLSMARQIIPLLGRDGLLPMESFQERGIAHFGSAWAASFRLPSFFWFQVSDAWLLALSWSGVALAAWTALAGAGLPMLLALWLIYQSVVNMGQLFYGYGWETLLLETGFLGLFLCPVTAGLYPLKLPRPSRAVFWLLRWLAFRMMFGAGMIKVRGDPCWLAFTCMDFHYETQPLPNPLSPWLHHLPAAWHRIEGALSMFIELVVPWLVFGPATYRIWAGSLMIAFQVLLILSGNLSWLNYATIVVCLSCYDDAVWRRLLPKSLPRFFARPAATPAGADAPKPGIAKVRPWAIGALCAVVGLLSIRPAWNLFSPGQLMNASFDPLHLVNTYGAFGSVGRDRNEIVLSGTSDPPGDSAHWREYEFPCKPGRVDRRPCVVAPYQYRLDWQIWFAAMEAPEDNPWLARLIYKLLNHDPGALGLLSGDPFPDGAPRYIKAELYRYRYSRRAGIWWEREKLGEYFPPLYLEGERLRAFRQ